MKYREGSILDLPQLKQLGKESYIEFSKVLSGEHWDKMFIFLKDEQALKDLIFRSKVFVCELDSCIIGMVYFLPSNHSDNRYDKDWSLIRYLGVLPKHRGKGIGRKLTKMCIQAAKELNEKQLALHTSEFMHSAIKMYEKLGFIKKEQFIHYRKNYWFYILNL